MGAVAVHHDLGRPAAAVVIGGHGEAVGAGPEHGQQVPLGEAQFTILAEEVTGFAHRSDDIPVRGLATTAAVDRLDIHPRLVQGRAQHIVHGRVHQREIVLRRGLEVSHPGEQQSRVGGDGATRLEQQLQFASAQLTPQGADVVGYRGGRFL